VVGLILRRRSHIANPQVDTQGGRIRSGTANAYVYGWRSGFVPELLAENTIQQPLEVPLERSRRGNPYHEEGKTPSEESGDRRVDEGMVLRQGSTIRPMRGFRHK